MKLVPIKAAPPARNARRLRPGAAYRTRKGAEARASTMGCRLFVTCTLGLSHAAPSFAASGEIVDKIATVLAIFIIIALPIAFVVLFWLVHVLPEKIAAKRQHPQKDAIHVLCLLSLVFGGLLWPLAWLWAYTRPVFHKLAYGRDKHDDFYEKVSGEPDTSEPIDAMHEELARLRRELEDLEERGAPPDAVRGLRGRLAQVENRTAPGNMGGGLR